MDYGEFLQGKKHLSGEFGFDPLFMPDFLFGFQKALVEWAVKKGRGAIFADCGLGKTAMELVWAQNIVEKTNKPVLILTPLAVSYQFKTESEKFGIECEISRDGKFQKKIVVTNYQRLHYFNQSDFIGVACDESGCIKHFKGVLQRQVTEFMKKIPYRILCTATAAPNDYIELGTSSEALGELGYMDMLGVYFKNDQNNIDTGRKWAHHGGGMPKWRFKKHAEKAFWQWVASWARAVRKPSDIGFEDNGFVLPPLIEDQYEIKNTRPLNGKMFVEEAVGRKEELEELRETIPARCEKVAELVSGHKNSVVWCHLNPEGDLLEKIIPGAVQVKGSQKDEEKEEKLLAFSRGEIKTLITKSKIAQFGMNWQNCNHTVFFPSHSWESYYQSIRRFWRFGQTRPVQADIVTTPALKRVLNNLKRKSESADKMFSEITRFMNDSVKTEQKLEFFKKTGVPSWV